MNSSVHISTLTQETKTEHNIHENIEITSNTSHTLPDKTIHQFTLSLAHYLTQSIEKQQKNTICLKVDTSFYTNITGKMFKLEVIF